jgi:hypothetical protein
MKSINPLEGWHIISSKFSLSVGFQTRFSAVSQVGAVRRLCFPTHAVCINLELSEKDLEDLGSESLLAAMLLMQRTRKEAVKKAKSK